VSVSTGTGPGRSRSRYSDRHRSFAHRRGNALDAPRANIADREDPGNARFEQMRCAAERPVVEFDVRPSLDELLRYPTPGIL